MLKTKRRCGCKTLNLNDFNKFVENLEERYNFSEADMNNFKSDLFNCYSESEKYFHIFELLTGLQFMLQSVIENLIIRDRLLYLQEAGNISECEIMQLFDPSISPRNKLIFAHKNLVK